LTYTLITLECFGQKTGSGPKKIRKKICDTNPAVGGDKKGK